MKRNWQHVEQYLDRLATEVLNEPPTGNHTAITQASFNRYILPNKSCLHRVVDVGCGPGIALGLFAQHHIPAVGVTLSEADVQQGRAQGFDVTHGDQSFLDFPDGHFDLVWSRHCLEHSPMPLLTLLEYNRVLRDGGFLYVEVPQPDSIHIDTPNHYSLLSDRGWRALFKRAYLAVNGYTVYTLARRWPNQFLPSGFIETDDYYYAYWLQKKRDGRLGSPTPAG